MNADARSIEKEEGCGVGNGLDRERVGVGVDDSATRTQIDNCHDHGNAKTTVTHSIGCCNGTQTGNCNHKMGYGLGVSARDKIMPDAGDNTINNDYCCCCCCRKQHT